MAHHQGGAYLPAAVVDWLENRNTLISTRGAHKAMDPGVLLRFKQQQALAPLLRIGDDEFRTLEGSYHAIRITGPGQPPITGEAEP